MINRTGLWLRCGFFQFGGYSFRENIIIRTRIYWRGMKMRRQTGHKRLFLIGLIVSLLIPVLAACTKEAQPKNHNTERTLRFASGFEYVGEDGQVFRNYTELFEFSHKDIRIETLQTSYQQKNGSGYFYIPPQSGEEEEQADPIKALIDLMTGPTPPDIVLIDYSHLPSLINENLLVSLDELILNEKDYNIDDFVPAVIEGLRKAGNGTLYALAPMFYSSALIYNKQLFLNKAVPFPTDGMTWQEMFELARRVTVKDEENPVYGFAFERYYGNGGIWGLQRYMTNNYTMPLGMKWIDEETLTMKVNTPAWQGVWKLFTDLYKEGVLPQEPDWSKPRDNPYAWDMFLSGEVAMTIVPYTYLWEIISANNNADRIDGFEPIDWDVVTVPTHPEAPGVGTEIYYDGLFAINAKAENMEDAWEFIKFITGEQWARVKSKSVYNIMSRKSFIEKIEGVDYNIDAFLQLFPSEYALDESRLRQKLPEYWSIMNIGEQKLADVINNNKSIELALQEWETEGQAMIQSIKERQQNGSDGGLRMIELPAIPAPVIID